MLVGAIVIWLVIGGAFGYVRARKAYVEELAAYPTFSTESPGKARRDALVEAFVVWLKWAVLGVFAVVAYLIVVIVELYAAKSR